MTATAVPHTARPVVFLVTDPKWPLACVEAVIEAAGRALPSGGLWVQLRDKTASPSDLARTAERLRVSTERVGASLVINAPSLDALRVAFDVRADGAHVPPRPDTIDAARTLLGGDAWISVPAHTDDDVAFARDAGVTCVLVSPIFATPGKGPARGVTALTAARALAPELFVVALGGIEPAVAADCASAGAHAVAVIRALLDAADPGATARALAAPFGQARRARSIEPSR